MDIGLLAPDAKVSYLCDRDAPLFPFLPARHFPLPQALRVRVVDVADALVEEDT